MNIKTTRVYNCSPFHWRCDIITHEGNTYAVNLYIKHEGPVWVANWGNGDVPEDIKTLMTNFIES